MKDKNLAVLNELKWKSEMNRALTTMKMSYTPFLKAISSYDAQLKQQDNGEKKLEKARLLVNRDAHGLRPRAVQLDSLQRNLLRLSRMAPTPDMDENEEETAGSSAPTLFVPAVFSSNDNEFSLSYPYNPNVYIQSSPKPKAVQKTTSGTTTVNSSKTEKRIEIIIEGKEKNKNLQIVIEIN